MVLQQQYFQPHYSGAVVQVAGEGAAAAAAAGGPACRYSFIQIVSFRLQQAANKVTGWGPGFGSSAAPCPLPCSS